jgi:hypothetical protein
VRVRARKWVRVLLRAGMQLMHRIVICGFPGSTTFFHIVTNGTIFEEKKIEYKLRFLILCANYV